MTFIERLATARQHQMELLNQLSATEQARQRLLEELLRLEGKIQTYEELLKEQPNATTPDK